MALRIRLARGGAKKRPFYRMVVAENTSPRDGRFIERVGSYNPLLEHGSADRVVVNVERVKYWLSVGAQASERVVRILSGMGLVQPLPRHETPKKSAPKKKALERLKAAEEAAKAATEKAAEPAAPVEEAQAEVESEPVSVEPEAAPVELETASADEPGESAGPVVEAVDGAPAEPAGDEG